MDDPAADYYRFCKFMKYVKLLSPGVPGDVATPHIDALTLPISLIRSHRCTANVDDFAKAMIFLELMAYNC
jgi:hypothetical protein